MLSPALACGSERMELRLRAWAQGSVLAAFSIFKGPTASPLSGAGLQADTVTTSITQHLASGQTEVMF